MTHPPEAPSAPPPEGAPLAARQSRFRGGRLARLALLAGSVLLGAAAAAAPVVVEVRDMRFTPAEVRVPVGTVVRWVNNEKRTTHSVLFTGPGAFESERFFPGEHYERRFDKPGRYPYICGPHPEMQGVVEVTP